MQHPHPAHRPWFLLGIFGAFVAFGMVAHRVGLHLLHTSWGERPLALAEFVGWEIASLAVTLLCGGLFVALFRGPPAKASRTAVSAELPLLFAMVAASAFCTSLEIRLFRAIQEGMTDAPVGVVIVMVLVGPVWLVCVGGVVAAARALLFVGRSRLELVENPLARAQPLAAVLEIPYAFDVAPTVTAELRCIYGESDAEFAHEHVVWSESLRIDAWEPAGPRRSRAEIRFELPEESQAGSSCNGSSYSWSLHARSETASAPLSASFLVPVEFA